ncbi:hypothetical protein ACIBKZ_22495 [Streptomyces sp. NPDC050421]|uniref:hypothetical protein n=1 Tax=Streptomyces sp. NPDC050421 TaxID=3365613 RepID=UPI0037BA2EE3
MAHRTDPTELDKALARILAEPTWAHQILVATAVGLAIENPFLVATTADIGAALVSVAECLLSHLPDVVADEAMERARAAAPMPYPRETHSAYALRLRAAAEAV